jgi:hypothetical protein
MWPYRGASSGRGHNCHLDRAGAARFNDCVLLYALVAHDSDFAVDVFPSQTLAEAALEEVLADEPGFQELLTIQAIADEVVEVSLN